MSFAHRTHSGRLSLYTISWSSVPVPLKTLTRVLAATVVAPAFAAVALTVPPTATPETSA